MKKLCSPACSKQENATFSPHIHGTWGPPFRQSLYAPAKGFVELEIPGAAEIGFSKVDKWMCFSFNYSCKTEQINIGRQEGVVLTHLGANSHLRIL